MSDELKQGRGGALMSSGCLARRDCSAGGGIAGRAGEQALSEPGLSAASGGGGVVSAAAAGAAGAGKRGNGAAVSPAGGAAAAAQKAPDKECFPEPPHDCALCPRLHDFLQQWRQRQPGWYNAPVRPFLPQGGLAAVRLLLVGLAPGLQGANRTGRPFTGDGCGPLLYNTLEKYGFARGRYQARPDDGLQLAHMAIVNAVRCVPPENRPLGAEIKACRRYLAPYVQDLPRLQVVVTLGKVAHESTLRALGVPLKAAPFIHGRIAEIDRGSRPGTAGGNSAGGEAQPGRAPAGRLRLISSYHCSRYNTSTGRLTEAMFHDIFAAARACLDSLQA